MREVGGTSARKVGSSSCACFNSAMVVGRDEFRVVAKSSSRGAGWCNT
jgi:hypothetical protein